MSIHGACGQCRDLTDLGFTFFMAFQPIVDLSKGEVFAQEALVRGPEGQGAGWVFEHVDESNQYKFDQACRVTAIRQAAELGLQSRLSINFMPNAVYRPEACIRATLAAADACSFPLDKLIFEITESERVTDVPHLRNIVEHYRKRGFMTAIDDFGAGYSGLNLLAELQTDLVKLDMALIRNIDADRGRRIIVRGILSVCAELDIRVIAEGVETIDELKALEDLGIELFQGYLFAKPAFRAIADVRWPRRLAVAS